MSGKSNGSFLLGVAMAAGAAAWVVNRRIQDQRAALWRSQHEQAGRETALVTGASSGIGEVYARRLAEMGYDLVLVARREEKLNEIAQELHQRFGTGVEVLPADLTTSKGIRGVEKRAAQGDIAFLVNNAGFGIPGRFNEISSDRIESMIRCHVIASVRLTHAALPSMLEQGRGAIVNVSSMSAFFNMPGDATYGPTKGYLNSFSESLALSLTGTGVRIQALCPGFTTTGFHFTEDYEGRDVHGSLPDWLWMDVEDVVGASLDGIARGQVVVVQGWPYKAVFLLGRSGIANVLLTFVTRLSPNLIGRFRGRAEPGE